MPNSLVLCLLPLRPGKSWGLGRVCWVPEQDLLPHPLLPTKETTNPPNKIPLPPPTPARNSFSSPASLLAHHRLTVIPRTPWVWLGVFYVNISMTMKMNHPAPFRSPENPSPITRGRAGETEELCVVVFQPDCILESSGALVK